MMNSSGNRVAGSAVKWGADTIIELDAGVMLRAFRRYNAAFGTLPPLNACRARMMPCYCFVPSSDDLGHSACSGAEALVHLGKRFRRPARGGASGDP